MGKVSKRQRKFLSKNVLPHRKKGGRRVDNKAKGNKGEAHDSRAPPQVAPERKTLPDGVDTAAFLDCPWLDPKACAVAGRDTSVPPFEPDASLLEASAIAPAKHTNRTTGNGLSQQTVDVLITRAVDEASLADLLVAVWALQMAQDAPSATTAAEKKAGPVALRAEAGSKALEVLWAQGLPRLHLAFRAHLGPEREEGDSAEEWEEAVRANRQLLEKSEHWPKLGGALLGLLTTALDRLEATSSTTMAALGEVCDEGSKKTGAALLEGLACMRHHIPLLFPFPRLARRYLAFLLSLLETVDDVAVLSLAFVRLYELSTSQPMPFLHDAFKGAYRCYRGAAGRIGGGRGGGGVAGGLSRGGNGAGSLPLLRECLAELFGVEKPSAYLHAYVYVHELVREALAAASEVQKGAGKAREAGPALRRLRSWDFLQSLQLWAGVVAAHSSKSSLGPLVPPLAKALEIALQLSPGLFGAPRTLALTRSAQDLAAASGVFLPTSHYLVGLLELLHAREGRHCASAGFPAAAAGAVAAGDVDGGGQEETSAGAVARKEGVVAGGKRRRAGAGRAAEQATVDLSAVAGLGKEDLRLGAVHAAVSRGAAGLIAREAVCYRWSAGLPELCAGVQARLERLLEGGCLPADGAGKCRARVKSLQVTLGKASAEAAVRRTKGSKHPGEAGPVDTFRGMEESTAFQRLKSFKELC